MATGVLVVAVGPATRLLRFATDQTKRYSGTITFGVATSSLDADGDIIETGPVDHLNLEAVAQAASYMIGESEQTPPMVSALKIGGKKLYELARGGIEVERAPRTINIFEFSVAPTSTPAVYSFDVRCSAGTYVRVIASDLAQRLGTVAHLSQLRRESSGPHTVAHAMSLDDVARAVADGHDVLQPPLGLVDQLERFEVAPSVALDVSHGKQVEIAASANEVAITLNNSLIGIVMRRGECYQPSVIIAPTNR
jgi:tRNA pseudouridine55 synthase